MRDNLGSIPDEFELGEMLDAELIKADLAGELETACPPPPFWHVEGKVLTWYGAKTVAEQNGIQIEDEVVNVVKVHDELMPETLTPVYEARVTVWITNNTLACTYRSRDAENPVAVARGLAFRKAVNLVCCFEMGDWQATKAEAERMYA